MGAERGDGERFLPPVEKLVGQVSPRNEDIPETFFLTRFKMLHFQHLQKRVAEIRGKNNFWGRLVWVPNAYEYEFIIIPKFCISDDTSSTLWHHVRPITYPMLCLSHSSGGRASDSRYRPPGYTRSPGSRRFGARLITAS